MKKLLLLVVFSVALAGCGSDSASTDSTDSQSYQDCIQWAVTHGSSDAHAKDLCRNLTTALAGVSAEATPDLPEFTFRASSHSPRWTVEGDDPGTFAQADAHECGAEAAPDDGGQS